MVILDVTCDLYEAFPGAGNDPLEGDDGGLGLLLPDVGADGQLVGVGLDAGGEV